MESYYYDVKVTNKFKMNLLFNKLPTVTDLSPTEVVDLIENSTEQGVTRLVYPDLIFAAKDIVLAPNTLKEVYFSKLQVVNGSIINESESLSLIELPEMIEGGYVDRLDSRVATLNLPKTKVLRELDLSTTKTCLESILLPTVERCSMLRMPTVAENLRLFTFGSNLKHYQGDFITTSNCLDQSSVNNVLESLAALDGTKGTTLYTNKVVIITGQAASPGVRGMLAIKFLQKRGCTVITN